MTEKIVRKPTYIETPVNCPITQEVLDQAAHDTVRPDEFRNPAHVMKLFKGAVITGCEFKNGKLYRIITHIGDIWIEDGRDCEDDPVPPKIRYKID